MNARIAIAGGGTGGHVTPALALGEALRERGAELVFVGAERGIEKKLVPDAGFELVLLDARPLIGRGIGERIGALFALGRATLAARRLLRERRIQLVVSVGGYASAPAAFAAALSRIPLALVNTDAVPGAANRAMARFATRIFAGFAGAQEALGPLGARTVVTGVPLRRALREKFADAASAARADASRPAHLFVFGGSLGARQINELMIALAKPLAEARVEIFHQTGEADRERVAAAYQEAGARAEVVAFEREMPRRYAWADLVVCRAGAISVAELALAGRAALLVPLGHVGGGEQFANARELERTGAARVLNSRDLSAADFSSALFELLGDRARLAEMGAKAAASAKPNATSEIAEACLALAGGPR
ncbi:MAG: undecaprenyldiphospho-muramoylpentapeptide beta-N-acetylglucosaminyltransferase [Deltaproteobacteria bacterium]|nr:undecaprenyldiphospho-muramoylpentapeptide beta-N-acetylglucosaminyltransferase [Deltaproteobacteria bacterium]